MFEKKDFQIDWNENLCDKLVAVFACRNACTRTCKEIKNKVYRDDSVIPKINLNRKYTTPIRNFSYRNNFFVHCFMNYQSNYMSRRPAKCVMPKKNKKNAYMDQIIHDV